MSHTERKSSHRSRMFPVEWPLTSETVATSPNFSQQTGSRKVAKTKRKSREGLDTKRQRVEQTEVKPAIDYAAAGPSNEVPQEASVNVFECFNEDEASWLADEINQANKNVFRAEEVAKKLRKDEDLEKKKESLNVLKNLVKDLRWNIKYPDEETAKNLETLDDASNNFGVRNMVNYLSLLDGYFVQLQNQMDK